MVTWEAQGADTLLMQAGLPNIDWQGEGNSAAWPTQSICTPLPGAAHSQGKDGQLAPGHVLPVVSVQAGAARVV